MSFDKYRIQELIEKGDLIINDGYRAKNTELSSTGIPFARGGNINSGFHFENADHFPHKDLPKVKDKISKPGDVVFTSKGTVGRFAYVTEDTSQFVYSPQLCYWRSMNNDRINSRFLFYWMNSKGFINQITAVKGQTDMADYVSLTDQRRMTITIPPLDLQLAIAGILSTLDDKIELNNRMNKVLELMAQAIFKQWFVDFEFPNENGDPYKSSGGEMEWCEVLGKDIPKGWKLGTLSHFVKVKYGKDHKKLADGSIPVYGSGGIMRYVDRALYSLESVLIPRKGTLNNVFYVSDPFWSVDTMFFTEMKFPNIVKFIYLFMKEKDLASMNVGSAVPSMTTDVLNNLDVVIPSMDVLLRFDEIVSPLFIQIAIKQKMNGRLTIIRDTLLPKLMSGEIDVSEIEL